MACLGYAPVQIGTSRPDHEQVIAQTPEWPTVSAARHVLPRFPSQRRVLDQMGRSVEVPVRPLRIVSLVPSLTELLFDLGVGDRVVGVTRFCTRPAGSVAPKTRVGGTKQLKPHVIDALEPDLVIGNKEENGREQIEALAQRHPVWLSDLDTLDGALEMIEAVGELVGARERAATLCADIEAGFAAIPDAEGLRVVYLIWRGPWMGAGGHTFIDDLLGRCGFANALAARGLERYPELSEDDLREAVPQLVLLSSEPFPFAEKHVPEVSAIVPDARVELVDGEAFSWFGSRLVESAGALARLVTRSRTR